jgi:hypothetical protein
MKTVTVLLGALIVASVKGQDGQSPQLRIQPDVQLLLALETRDAAMVRILARGEYRGPGDYKEREQDFEVGHVVMCPQARGLPLFAVFSLDLDVNLVEGPPHVARGGVAIVASDGALVRWWRAHNLAKGVFADVNEDGIVERVETMTCVLGEAKDTTVRELFVLPVTEEMVPSLRVAFDVVHNRNLADEPEHATAWRVLPAREGQPARVQIGPKDARTGDLSSVAAEWTWKKENSAWVGPGGGPSMAFVRLPPIGVEGLYEFALAHKR